MHSNASSSQLPLQENAWLLQGESATGGGFGYGGKGNLLRRFDGDEEGGSSMGSAHHDRFEELDTSEEAPHSFMSKFVWGCNEAHQFIDAQGNAIVGKLTREGR